MVGQQVALREAFFGHLQRRAFPGGASLLAGAGDRHPPGALKERVAAFEPGSWR